MRNLKIIMFWQNESDQDIQFQNKISSFEIQNLKFSYCVKKCFSDHETQFYKLKLLKI